MTPSCCGTPCCQGAGCINA
uniref:Uncharacterized protein n=1 Tax=Arundo donax TaxID=35708 RepID=A0A0A9BW86_ARUDO